jgi:hypothetical protein
MESASPSVWKNRSEQRQRATLKEAACKFRKAGAADEGVGLIRGRMQCFFVGFRLSEAITPG